jgi:hypothetical protein
MVDAAHRAELLDLLSIFSEAVPKFQRPKALFKPLNTVAKQLLLLCFFHLLLGLLSSVQFGSESF